MGNESRFMRELRLRQSRINDRRLREPRITHASKNLETEDSELEIVDSKIMDLCNETDGGDDESTNASRLQVLAQQTSRASARSHHNTIRIETRDEDDEDVDFVVELAESISAQPSRLFCDELAREVELGEDMPRNDAANDQLDEMLDEALRDYDEVESHNAESEESESSTSSDNDTNVKDIEDAESLNSSIVSDDLRLILSESGVSASTYQVASFYGFPAAAEQASNNNSKTQTRRMHLHKKILITQPHHVATTVAAAVDSSKTDDASDDAAESDNDDSQPDEDEEEDEFEYEYFPEPSVVDMLPGLNAALDALAEKFSFGPCAKEENVLEKAYREDSARMVAPRDNSCL